MALTGGKLFESLYRGSMLGSPASVWIVWPYIIAHARPLGQKVKGVKQSTYCEINPRLIAMLSCDLTEEQVVDAIRILMSKDPNTSSPDFDGRRLVPVHPGTLEPIADPDSYEVRSGANTLYLVVNGEKYRSMRFGDERTQQTREAVRRHRAKKKAQAIDGD